MMAGIYLGRYYLLIQVFDGQLIKKVEVLHFGIIFGVGSVVLFRC